MKKVIAALSLLILGCYAYVMLYADSTKEVDMKKNIAVIIASNGFQEHEYQATHAALEDAGYAITVISDKPGIAVGHAGAQVEVDCAIPDVQPSQYKAFYMIGGPGTLDCLDNPVTYKLLNEVFALQKPYGAICLAPRVFANAELLQHKRATGWDGDGHLQDVFTAHNVTYVHEPVVIDGNIVTANGPQAATDFGAAIVAVLQES